MKIALLIAAVSCLTFPQDTPTATFTEPFVGFQFKHSKAWTIVKSTKRKDSARTTFSIPIEGSSDKAELDIDRTDYHASIDLWQTIQLRANEQLHRQMVRQWTQEVLGVSMLFSRVEYTERGTAMTSVLGLFYTKTSQKMLIRLSSPAGSFDKVFYEFGQVLETLKSVDGKLPEEDDPSKELAPAPKKPERADLAPHPIDSPKNHKNQAKMAPVAIEVVVSTRKLNLRIPEEWKGEGIKDNTLQVTGPLLSKPLHIELFSLLDSDPALTALTKVSSTSLANFVKVDRREDTGPTNNRAGCSVSSTWRTGTDAKGSLMTCEAAGSMGGYYFVLTYSQTDAVAYKADRKLIEQLLKTISLEIVP